MDIKELIQAELEFLSVDDLSEVYELIIKCHQKYEDASDDLDKLLKDCQMKTGIFDLSYQHDHYLYGVSKKN